MAISLFVLNIVFIVGSITFPNKVCAELVSQNQSSDWIFAGLSFLVEPQSQIVPRGTPSVELKCKGRSISYSDEGMIYTTPESSPPHSTKTNGLIETEDVPKPDNGSDDKRIMFNSPFSNLNIKDRTEHRHKSERVSDETPNPRESKRKHSSRKNNNDEKRRYRKSRQAMASKMPILYSWYLNGTLINATNSNSEFRRDGSLVITNIGVYNSSDYGEYRCVISQKNVGAIASRAAHIQYPVLTRPIVSSTTDGKAFVGESVLLTCQFRSIPESHVRWERDGLQITLNNRIFQLPTGSLIINNIILADSGLYRCVIKNEFLQQTRHSLNYTLEVLLPNTTVSQIQSNSNISSVPLVNALLHNLTVEEGSNLDMPCALTVSQVMWTFIPKNGTLQRLEDAPILRLRNIMFDQTGLYVCASSSDSMIKRRYLLQVNTQPYFATVPTNSHTLSPKIVRFNCSAVGNPVPNVTWFKDGVPLYINGRVKIKANSLVISHTQASDAGIYQCIASNSVKENTVAAVLQFKNDKIHPAPKGVKCQPLNSTTILVEWEKTTGDIFTLHIVQSEGGTEMQKFPQHNHYYKVPDLQPFTSYDFYVKRFHSEKGKIAPSEQSKIVKCSPQGLNVVARAENINNTIIVQWFAPKTKRQIQSYLLQWRMKNTPNNITEIMLSGNITEKPINGITNPSSFEVRVLASYNNDFLDQNLESIVWSQLSRKATSDRNVVSMAPEDSPNVYSVLPPNAFRAQNLNNENLVNISWTTDDANENLFKVCYSAINVMGHHVLNPDTCMNRSESWVIVNDLHPQKSYEFSIMKYTRNSNDLSRISAILHIHRGYGEIRNLSAYWLYNSTAALVSWTQPKYFTKILQYTLRYCPGPGFLKCTVRTFPMGLHSSRIEDLDVTNSLLITMYVEMQNGKGKPTSFKLLPLHYNITTEPNPVLGIVLGVTISVLCITLCLFLVFRGNNLKCKDTRHCWKNRSVYTTRNSTAQTSIPAPLMPNQTESLLHEPNQNFEMQCWKQLSAKSPSQDVTVAHEENQQNTSTHPLLDEIISALHHSDGEMDANLCQKSSERQESICKACNIDEIESSSLINHNDIKMKSVDEDDLYKELSTIESMTRLKEILIGNNDTSNHFVNCNNQNSIFSDKKNNLVNNVNSTDILLKLDTVNQNNKRSKSTSPTLGCNG